MMSPLSQVAARCLPLLAALCSLSSSWLSDRAERCAAQSASLAARPITQVKIIDQSGTALRVSVERGAPAVSLNVWARDHAYSVREARCSPWSASLRGLVLVDQRDREWLALNE